MVSGLKTAKMRVRENPVEMTTGMNLHHLWRKVTSEKLLLTLNAFIYAYFNI